MTLAGEASPLAGEALRLRLPLLAGDLLRERLRERERERDLSSAGLLDLERLRSRFLPSREREREREGDLRLLRPPPPLLPPPRAPSPLSCLMRM